MLLASLVKNVYLHHFCVKVRRTCECGFLYLTRTLQMQLHCSPPPPPLVHISPLPAKIEVLITSWDELSCSLYTRIHLLCYQPSGHTCFQLAIIFKFATVKILLLRCQQMTFAGL